MGGLIVFGIVLGGFLLVTFKFWVLVALLGLCDRR